MITLQNKTALVTGASRGIGRATAAALAVTGAHVLVHYGRSTQEAESLVAAIRRIGDYAVDYALVQLDKIAGETKVMPDAFIAASASDITPAYRDYLRPLLGR